MVYGFPYGCPYGNHTWPIVYQSLRNIVKPNNVATADWILEWIVADQCDMYWRVAIDGYKVGKPVYSRAGIKEQLLITIPPGNRLVSLCPQGQFGDNNVRIQDQIEAFYENGRNFPNHFSSYIRSDPSLSIGGSIQFSSISASGLKRGLNMAPAKGRPTWGVLDLTLSTVGGVHTLSGSCNGSTMITGSRTGDGAITLAGAGASVTLTLTYTGDFDSGVQLIARWPAKFNVYVKSSAFVDGDFPRANNGQVLDDGFSNAFVFKSLQMPAGSWYVVIHAIGDDGNESTSIQGGGQIVVVYAVPDPATNLHYVSGGGTNTVVGWTAPASDATVTYNYYDSLATGIMQLVAPTGTHAAGATPTQALASIGAFTGNRYVMVRSVKNGIEEPSLNMIAIEYAAGVVVPTRPMAAAAGQHWKTFGRTISVPVSVYVDDSILVYPQSIELYLYLVGGSPNYSAPDASIPMPGNPANAHAVTVSAQPVRSLSGNIVYDVSGNIVYSLGFFATAAADGEYYFEVGTTAPSGAKTLTGIVYGPVILTQAAMAEPTFVTQEA